MGRKKAHPVRAGPSGGILSGNLSNANGKLRTDNKGSGSIKEDDSEGNLETCEPLYVKADSGIGASTDHLDLAEVVLKDISSKNGYLDQKFVELGENVHDVSLQFRLPRVGEDSFRLGHWPVLPAETILLEYSAHCISEDGMTTFSGTFDGPDESVSGLVHLISQKILSLRPVIEEKDVGKFLTFRARVEILRSAFDLCDSLLDIPRHPWRKSMMSVMSWLRPEVMTSEAKYRSITHSAGFGQHPEVTGDSISMGSDTLFDVVSFYEAIKPTKQEPMLEDKFPDLLPQLRPYQRRAAYWMVQRETASPDSCFGNHTELNFSPLCVPVVFLDGHTRMFYNPFCGTVSLRPEQSARHIYGGILADEMGLGKTIELLACISAHRMASSMEDADSSVTEVPSGNCRIKRVKQDRVECICGAVTESHKYEGLWVQCDICDAWQHADCVGYHPPKNSRKRKFNEQTSYKKNIPSQSKLSANKKSSNVTEIDGDYICSLCLELTEAARSIIISSATLIVCPAPILAQWYSEIIRHTRRGSMQTYIYEGARNLNANALVAEMTKLANADIVLTTYDVLKEDLSHDSDRHDGDRRLMRFQKRYPVVPTILTRIYWWRLCLDEAQMVESNAASVSEMALRLRARYKWCITGTPIQRRIDDLYGLLRFLGAAPFDVYKWWVEVIRDPYERRDMLAMEFTHNFFKKIMWRSAKSHVSDELGLPPQDECMTHLKFSPVEEHFYRKQHETCVRCAQEVIESFKSDLCRKNGLSVCDAVLSHIEAAKILYPLLKLRQACCHPQVGSSGLRSLQQSPMTMDEILEVLICKAKIEGEEALRRIVVALNGLAALSVIQKDTHQAVILYREALVVAAKNADDFRLDPLLSLHIHHNMADLVQGMSDHIRSPESSQPEHRICQDGFDICSRDLHRCDEEFTGSSVAGSTEHCTSSGINSCLLAAERSENQFPGYVDAEQSMSFNQSFLKLTCENYKQQYLSVFVSKLSAARQEFRNTYTQVSDLLNELRTTHEHWWLQVLNLVEQNNDLSLGLMKKIEQALSGSTVGGNGYTRAPPRLRGIKGLKYMVQTGLDSLEAARRTLLERLLEINETMDDPREDDIERVRYCPNCLTGDGPLCIHCELDGLFQVYEARLFRLKKGDSMIASAEEAINSQRCKNDLNLFFRGGKFDDYAGFSEEKNKGMRNVGTNIVVSRSPSDIEIILGTIKSYTKSLLKKEGAPSAMRHLLLLETMRKEFVHARSLSIAQAQILRAHDEIKMAQTRLRLRECEDEPIAVNVLSEEELIPSSMQFTSDKFSSLSSLARIKGQLRYLKGLVTSKKKNPIEVNDGLSSSLLDNSHTCLREEEHQTQTSVVDDEPCPVCHDKLAEQKMVFQCGHITCCRCFLELTEQSTTQLGKAKQKWVMCPTCRQHTNYCDVAFVDEKEVQRHDSQNSCLLPGQNLSEISIEVQGSYGTKIEAITRRILWIRSSNQEAKVIVFSSWNDVLDVLEHALRTNNISYVRMKGGRNSQVALAKFKGYSSSDPEGIENPQQAISKPKFVQVLLLLIRHGANGLNILEAQHVILVEPLLNPGAEAQAINRVHRIGQEKKTFVHRFIVNNTVEESICKLNKNRMVTVVQSKSKCPDQPRLTLRDFESLFSSNSSFGDTAETGASGSLMHLPPSLAAGLAAERRLAEGQCSRGSMD